MLAFLPRAKARWIPARVMLNEYDLVDYGRLYEEFEDITDNDEYWYDRKREIEDDEEADESRIRRVVRCRR